MKSTLIAQSLMTEETTEAFEWLFTQYLTATNGYRPTVLMTDHDAAMEAAIESTAVAAYHRLCIWHIQKNLRKHLGLKLKDHYIAFIKEFSTLAMSEYSSTEAWQTDWEQMTAKYDTIAGEELKHLRYLYGFKEKWAQAFHERHFSAQLYATSRGESYNSLVKRFLSLKTTLEQVMTLLAEDSERKNKDRTDTLNGADLRQNVQLIDQLECYKRMASVVTRKVFHDEINEQMTLSKTSRYNLSDVLDDDTGELRELQVQAEGRVRRLTLHKDGNTKTIQACSCLYSVSMGLPCRHMFHAVSRRDQPSDRWTISDACILPRWHRDIEKYTETYELKLIHLLDAPRDNEPSAHARTRATSDSVRLARFGSLVNKYKPFFDYMSRNEERYNKALGIGTKLLEVECSSDVPSAESTSGGQLVQSNSSTSDTAQLEPTQSLSTGTSATRRVRNPSKPTRRGRPPT